MSATAARAIAFEDVSKWYRNGTLALRDVSFTVATGARTGLLGPNGAGKSTAAKVLNGTLTPSAGVVTVLGATASGAGFDDARRRIGVVPQSAGAYRDLSGAEYLDLARGLYRAGSIAAVVERFGLGPHLAKPMSELSGGLQKRVSLAAALLGDPELLILDEPSLGLDPIATNDIHAQLRALAAGRTMLICTNDLDEAEAVCDDVIIVNHGRVVLHETIANLRARRPRMFIRALGPRAALVSFLDGRGLTTESRDDGVLADLGEGVDYDSVAPGLLRAALAAGLDVTECRPVATGLEAAFFESVGASNS